MKNLILKSILVSTFTFFAFANMNAQEVVNAEVASEVIMEKADKPGCKKACCASEGHAEKSGKKGDKKSCAKGEKKSCKKGDRKSCKKGDKKACSEKQVAEEGSCKKVCCATKKES